MKTDSSCEALAKQEHAAGKARPCTCHPDDNPPVPCAQKYALSECKAADKAQEWTAIHEQNSDGWYVCSNGEPIIAWPFTGREAKAIADTHNASITAERERKHIAKV